MAGAQLSPEARAIAEQVRDEIGPLPPEKPAPDTEAFKERARFARNANAFEVANHVGPKIQELGGNPAGLLEEPRDGPVWQAIAQDLRDKDPNIKIPTTEPAFSKLRQAAVDKLTAGQQPVPTGKRRARQMPPP
jgi:hypothetical protein